jgi:hypothetical protein
VPELKKGEGRGGSTSARGGSSARGGTGGGSSSRINALKKTKTKKKLAGEKAEASSEESSTRTEPFGAEVDELEVEDVDGSGGEPLGVWTFKEEDPLRPVQCVRMCRYACARARRRNYVPG